MPVEQKSYPFPEDLTRRERWLFEKYAGCTLSEFGKMLKEEPDKLTVQMETALLLIAVKRVRPSVTFDQVLDSDWDLEKPQSKEPEQVDPESPEVDSEMDPSLPPPTTTT